MDLETGIICNDTDISHLPNNPYKDIKIVKMTVQELYLIYLDLVTKGYVEREKKYNEIFGLGSVDKPASDQ